MEIQLLKKIPSQNIKHLVAYNYPHNIVFGLVIALFPTHTHLMNASDFTETMRIP